MSETSEFDTPDHGITADDRLVVPDDLSHLQRRQLELTKLPRPLHIHRAELRALLLLTINGSVSAGEIWDTLRRYYGAGGVEIDTPQAKTSQPLAPLHRDLEVAWNNLQRLCAGEAVFEPMAPVPGNPDSADDDAPAAFEQWIDWQNAQTREWFRQVMQSAGAILDSYGNVSLSTSEVHSDVPRQLQREITEHHDIAWRGSAFSLGASIEALPGIIHDYYGGVDSDLAIMEAWATAVMWALDACEATRESDEQHATALSQLDWFWMIFKGFVRSSLDSGLVGRLYTRPYLLNMVCDALLQGRDMLRQHSDKRATKWHTRRGEINDKVELITTEDLVSQVHDKVEEARADAEALEFLR